MCFTGLGENFYGHLLNFNVVQKARNARKEKMKIIINFLEFRFQFQFTVELKDIINWELDNQRKPNSQKKKIGEIFYC